MSTKCKQIARIVLDIFIFALVCFAEFAAYSWFSTFHRGFFCGDESLAYPLRPSTIGLKALIIIVLTVPTAVILAVELFKRLEVPSSLNGGSEKSTNIQRRLVACYKQIGSYLFGLAITLLVTEVGKLAAGRLRPHFFAVCQPQLEDGSTCADAKNHGIYIENYTCRGGENVTEHVLHELGHSFPSGHASIFFYSMLYAAIYLQATLSTRASKLLKHLLQFIFVVFAWFVALTRIADYWHHWSDVLSGALLGTFIAVIVTIFIADLFKRKHGGLFIGGAGDYVVADENGMVAAPVAKANSPSPALPSYTFGMPYLHNAYGQPYNNYGYVP